MNFADEIGQVLHVPAANLEETFVHTRGIGPVTQKKLQARGYRSWGDVLQNPDGLPLGEEKRRELLQTSRRGLEALARKEVGWFIAEFSPSEHWRILEAFWPMASWFDIETTSFDRWKSEISVIACHHRGETRTFVKGENLDDFLELLEEVGFLVSFNGNSFDVPMVLDEFHIPELPCSHLDLRWVCYHAGLRGGLKDIEVQCGIRREAELEGISGYEAILLWEEWKGGGSRDVLDLLVKYCAKDAAGLEDVARSAVNLY